MLKEKIYFSGVIECTHSLLNEQLEKIIAKAHQLGMTNIDEIFAKIQNISDNQEEIRKIIHTLECDEKMTEEEYFKLQKSKELDIFIYNIIINSQENIVDTKIITTDEIKRNCGDYYDS